MAGDEDRYYGTCDVCRSQQAHRVWCSEGGGLEVARPDNCTVAVDHEQFPAYVDPDQPLRNGAVTPGFSAAVVDQVVAWLNDRYTRGGGDCDRAEWDGDVVVVYHPNCEGAEGYRPERVAADSDGRFYLGAPHYNWQKTSEVHGGREPLARRERSAYVGAARRRGRSHGPGRGR